jgi:cytochrome P450
MSHYYISSQHVLPSKRSPLPGGTTIPNGARITLVLASDNLHPERFGDSDHFDADRQDNQHPGFGSDNHICFGAPLARLEV